MWSSWYELSGKSHFPEKGVEQQGFPLLEMWKLRQIQSRNAHIDRTRNSSVINKAFLLESNSDG